MDPHLPGAPRGLTRRTVTLPRDASGRLDAALSRLLPHVSRRRLKRAFREGRIEVAGRRVRGSHPASGGLEVVLVGLDDATSPAPCPMPIETVYEDPWLLVVEKPAGLPVLPRTPEEAGSVAGAVLARRPELRGVGDLPLAPGLCHRLDRETSGLLLFAKDPDTFAVVRRLFERRAVDKRYLAVVAGVLRRGGSVRAPIGRPAGRGAMLRVDDGRTRLRKVWPALTHYQPLRSRGDRTLVEVRIETGVTHQIRVHLASIGHPLLGDVRYGGPAAPRLALHASSLGLPHPRNGRWLVVHSPGADAVATMLDAPA